MKESKIRQNDSHRCDERIACERDLLVTNAAGGLFQLTQPYDKFH